MGADRETAVPSAADSEWNHPRIRTAAEIFYSGRQFRTPAMTQQTNLKFHNYSSGKFI
jgi:hypothetical protein